MKNNNSKTDSKIVLIGYERQENIGLRSITAYLEANGYKVLLLPFLPNNEDLILSEVKSCSPCLIGFSIIFQYTIEEFSSLMHFLRTNNVTAHFTAGGHYPSLRPKETMNLIPDLDSVVRFEGEFTILELLKNLNSPENWEHISGLAFRKNSKVKITKTRPLISNLDILPKIKRGDPQEMSNGIKVAAMLASRGCFYNCSFCSIRQFYGSAKGKLRRVRSPKNVVMEMAELYNKENIRLFSFQDDDFGAKSMKQTEWLDEFLNELCKHNLAKNIAWKISCRVDDLDSDKLKKMIDHGLFAVYLGVESGNEIGLKTLNKNVSLEQNIFAVDLLKNNNVAVAIGFMLFDPSSSIDTIKQNIAFLRKIGEDGYFPINFCKMLPYAGTKIEEKLLEEGRLKGSVTQPTYNFKDPIIDWYEFFVQKIFSKRNFDPDGLVSLLQQTDFDWRLNCYFSERNAHNGFEENLRKIIKDTNNSAVETLEILLENVLEIGVDKLLDEQDFIVNLFEKEWRAEMNAELTIKKMQASKDKKRVSVFN